MRSGSIVVAAPALESGTGVGERAERSLIQELVAQAAIEALPKAFWIGLPGAM